MNVKCIRKEFIKKDSIEELKEKYIKYRKNNILDVMDLTQYKTTVEDEFENDNKYIDFARINAEVDEDVIRDILRLDGDTEKKFRDKEVIGYKVYKIPIDDIEIEDEITGEKRSINMVGYLRSLEEKYHTKFIYEYKNMLSWWLTVIVKIRSKYPIVVPCKNHGDINEYKEIMDNLLSDPDQYIKIISDCIDCRSIAIVIDSIADNNGNEIKMDQEDINKIRLRPLVMRDKELVRLNKFIIPDIFNANVISDNCTHGIHFCLSIRQAKMMYARILGITG